jgi:two-component system LytT family response regulator
MTLKTIIVEDEKHSRETLKNLLEKFCEDVEVIAMTSGVKEAIELLSVTTPDVVFLDIELQKGTGFDILSALPEIDFEIVFTTAFDQYAIKAVKFSSLDYLLKPIDLEELQQAIAKVRIRKDKNTYNRQLAQLLKNMQQTRLSKISLATLDGFEFVDISNIIYCEAGGSYTTFVLTDGKKLLVSKHLKEYENLLQDHHFMRVHNSYLINLKEVKKFVKSDGGYIIMNNNDIVSISRNKKEIFIETMQNY